MQKTLLPAAFGAVVGQPNGCAGAAACEPANQQAPLVTAVPTTSMVCNGAQGPDPINVQTANDARLRGVQSLNLPDFMASQLGVYVSEIQGNPYQVNVSYRGFTAGALLGTQGLSVYQEGSAVAAPGAWRSEVFVAPGASRAAWIGVRLQLDG